MLSTSDRVYSYRELVLYEKFLVLGGLVDDLAQRNRTFVELAGSQKANTTSGYMNFSH